MAKTPQPFEISDLDIQESDRIYAAAVHCVRTYWKQATRMTVGQCERYISFLKGEKKAEYLLPPSSPEYHRLYMRARGFGFPTRFLASGLDWADYLLLSSLYQRLPTEYTKAIEARYSTSIIADHTDEYRRVYPVATTGQQETATQCIVNRSLFNATLLQGELTSTRQQNDTPTRMMHGAPVLTSQNEKTTPAGTLFLPAPPATTQSVEEETWNIDNVVGILSLQNKKRLCPSPESSSKRARLDDNEILEKVNQQAEVIQQAMDKLQCNQDIKLQEVREAVEQNKQALGNMQSELRQFMSAVASTLREIKDRLDE